MRSKVKLNNNFLFPSFKIIQLEQHKLYLVKTADEKFENFKTRNALESNNYILATWCRRSLIFQTLNSVRSNNPSLKYQRFTPLGTIKLELSE